MPEHILIKLLLILHNEGYSVITTASELADLQSLENNATNSTKVLGLFSPGNMNMSWTGEAASISRQWPANLSRKSETT